MLLGVGVGALVAGSVNLMLPQHTHQGQLEAPAKVREVRRDLARVKTILREKEA